MATLFYSIVYQHDLGLVFLAAAICALGSFGFFLLLKRSCECSLRRWGQWRAVAALSAGIGVWATHFVAMLAYKPAIHARFDIGLTSLSVVLCVLLIWIAVRTLGRTPNAARIVGAGLLATIGVASMHFVGMAAMMGAGGCRYDLVAVGTVMAVTASCFIASFALFARLAGARQLPVAAAFALVAVCCLHFGSMAAMTMEHSHQTVGGGDSRLWLVGGVVAVSLTLLLLIAGGALVDRYMTDLRGFADATLEALAIVVDDRIFDVNARFATIVGAPAASVVGCPPDRWLKAQDGQPLMDERAGPVEATLIHSADERVFEIATHAIEYRGRDARVLALRDLTEKKKALRRVEFMARHDALTKLANRAAMDDWLGQLDAAPGFTGALIAIDLDRFKPVNDIFGHAAGDAILCKIADIISDCCRNGERIARMGGDEFLVLQADANPSRSARLLTNRILAAVRDAMNPLRDPMAVGMSIGVALFPHDAQTSAELRNAADLALYRAKDQGRGRACFFDNAMDEALRQRRAIEQDLRHAILRNQLSLVFQPLVETRTRTVIGYEALLRWQHPERGEVLPEIFIPIAEESGSIIPIGDWVIDEACKAAATWPQHLSVAINVSPVQFQVGTLPETISSAMRRHGIAPERVDIEITEGVLLRDRQAALGTLNLLKALGIRISMDDFGTGYSSLSNLQSFPFDKIKIDKSFIAALSNDDAARSIIRAIVGLGRSLGLPVVAEGVETEAQRLLVEEEGCPIAQGYLFGRPDLPDHSTQDGAAAPKRLRRG